MAKQGKLPHGSRVWLAWNRCEELLADGEWHYTSMVVQAMMEAGGIVKKTAANLLTEGVGYGVIERQGYKRGLWNGGYVDKRMVRLIPAKEERIERERAQQERHQGSSPTPRRGEVVHETTVAPSDKPPSRTPRTPKFPRDELDIHLSQTPIEFRDPRAPVNPPGKTFTPEEAEQLQRQRRQRKARRKPPEYGL